MKVALYPGNFDPFHHGHAHIVNEAVKCGDYDKVVVCVTGIRDSWFDVAVKAEMARSYDLDPDKVEVDIWGPGGNMWWAQEDITIVRGYRNQHDLDFEEEVRTAITEQTGYTEFRYFKADCNERRLSSTKVRKAAETLDLAYLKEVVTPQVITVLMERTLKAKLYVVCGRPASGKSTVLREVAKVANVGIIKVDEVVADFKQLLREKFKTEDLVELVKTREKEVAAFQGPLLLSRISELLLSMVGQYDVILLECAYALKYQFDQYFGARMLFVDCTDFKGRNLKRGTPQHIHFAKTIPSYQDTKLFCNENGIELKYFDNNDPITEVKMLDLFALLSED